MTLEESRQEVSFDDSIIFWKRLAEPQLDQYDSLTALEFAHNCGYVRRENAGAPTFFDGKVAIRNDSALSRPDCVPAPPAHPNIERACNLIRLWPKVFTQFQLLTESVSVFTYTQTYSDTTRGSTCNTVLICGSGKRGFGTISSTINSDIGFAEALVHEMAHHKLWALGVGFESAERIIRNTPEQKFRSPIKYDCLRPMSAVLHAQYSYTYVCALEIEIIKAGKELERNCGSAQASLAKNLPKLEFGLKVIQDNAEVDSAGADFLEGYFAWLNRVLEDGYKILDEFKISPQTFVHPLDAHDDQEDAMNLLKKSYTKPCRQNGIEEHCLGDEMLLYFLEKEIGVSLNSSAKAIWELCNGKLTISEISEKLAMRFGCSGEAMLPDVEAAIIQFCKLGLLELEGASDARSM